MCAENKQGFTIVELLIVIVVIGILAAITIVAFSGIQNKSYDAVIQQDLSAFAKKVELYRVDDASGLYPGTSTNLSTLLMKATQSAYDTSYYNLYYCVSGAKDRFTFAARSKSGVIYYASSQGKGNIGNLSINAARTCSTVGIDTAVDSYVNITGKSNNGTGDWAAWAI